ncbi:MFS transporter [Allonocardiopsis opalescens]|uniref:Sugar phosphate permease n=1 Tax=Allonocardiopsis opalescens TaxID=1144618 RepID=A0A2T0PY69_9ACTN|nr:MFS transporter [Allonocardiopsis opalescens]PRX96483.1 sugar phosphate permease [Allonocardiopsis opalescens]
MQAQPAPPAGSAPAASRPQVPAQSGPVYPPYGAPLRGEVRDCYGRRYVVGPPPREIIGRDRVQLLRGAWLALVTIGFLQYAYGVAVPTLLSAHGWTHAQAFGVLALWAVCQGAVAYPAARLRAAGRLLPRTAMLLGAGLCAAGLLLFAWTDGLAWALIGYSVLCGVGAGLVYHTCTSTVARWYPERPATRAGLVSGAFAYGAIPVIAVFGLWATPAGLEMLLTVLALVVGAVVAACGWHFADPPRDWWPTAIDPRSWAVDKRLNRSRAANPPAVREFSPAEALRSRCWPLLFGTLALAGAVSLFNIAYLADFTLRVGGFGLGAAALAAGVLVGANGASRVVASRLSDRLGRRRTLSLVLAVGALAQFGLLYGGSTGSLGVLLAAALLAGLGGGSFYPLFSSLALEYYGARDVGSNTGAIYSAKVVGGVIGIGLTALAVTGAGPPEQGYAIAFCAAGAAGLLAAALTRLLRQPGHPRTLPAHPR